MQKCSVVLCTFNIYVLLLVFWKWDGKYKLLLINVEFINAVAFFWEMFWQFVLSSWNLIFIHLSYIFAQDLLSILRWLIYSFWKLHCYSTGLLAFFWGQKEVISFILIHVLCYVLHFSWWWLSCVRRREEKHAYSSNL